MNTRPIYDYSNYQGDRFYHQKKRLLLKFLAKLGLVTGIFLSCLGQSNAADHAAVLMYHRFGEDKYPSTNIRLDQFDAHLEELASGNYTVLSLAKIIRHIQDGTELPDRTVAITIDDAYLSVFTEAWPRLRAKGFPFTVFVATDPVDNGHSNYMSWDQLRQLQANGIDIGSQTKTHPWNTKPFFIYTLVAKYCTSPGLQSL